MFPYPSPPGINTMSPFGPQAINYSSSPYVAPPAPRPLPAWMTVPPGGMQPPVLPGMMPPMPGAMPGGMMARPPMPGPMMPASPQGRPALNPQDIESRLSSSQAVPVGAANGLIFGALAGIPIWGAEQLLGKSNIVSELSRNTHGNLARRLERPGYNLATSVATTAGVGMVVGGFLAWWLVGKTRERLLEISKVTREQRAGTYVPEETGPISSMLMALHLKERPVTNPAAAAHELEEENLDSKNAFWQGVKAVLFFKVLAGIVAPGTLLGGAYMAARAKMGKEALHEMVGKLPGNRTVTLKMVVRQPLFWLKLAATPLLGGIIAKQLVPWMRQQLGLPQEEKKSEAAHHAPAHH